MKAPVLMRYTQIAPGDGFLHDNVEEDGVFLLIFVKTEGKGKLQLGKTFNYGIVRNIEYEDSDSPNILLDVESSVGTQQVLVDEGNLVAKSCYP